MLSPVIHAQYAIVGGAFLALLVVTAWGTSLKTVLRWAGIAVLAALVVLVVIAVGAIVPPVAPTTAIIIGLLWVIYFLIADAR